jgi:energy-coupling factor transport system substrate-specific component
MKRLSTAYLLTCAAIGVAGALLLAPANWLSTLLFATVPFASVAVAGLWLLPAVVALRLLQRPLAGLLTGLISGLVLVPFSGYGFGSVLTNLWWSFFPEAAFLIVAWRFWTVWQHYAGAVLAAIVYPLAAAASFDLASMTLGAQAGFIGLTLASCVGATALGIFIAGRLRRAGVAATVRAKPRRSTSVA